MTLHRWTMAVALVLPVQAQDPRYGTGATEEPAPRGVNSPLLPIYRVPGVADNGAGATAGVATSFLCSNLRSVTEKVRIVVRGGNATVLADQSFDVGARTTHTFVTHSSVAFAGVSLNTGLANQGLATIYST